MWRVCRAQAANWLTLKKTVFPGWTRGNKGNRMLLSGLADAKIKEYSWLRVNTPHFLVHHSVFDHSVFAFVWKQRGQLLTYFFFCQLVVYSCSFPPSWIWGVLSLVDSQTASTGCSSQAQCLHHHNTWMWPIVWFSAFLGGWAHVNREFVVSKTVVLTSHSEYAMRCDDLYDDCCTNVFSPAWLVKTNELVLIRAWEE